MSAVSHGSSELAPFEISAFGRGFLWPDVKVPREAAPVLVAERSRLLHLSMQTPCAHGPISETTMPTAWGCGTGRVGRVDYRAKPDQVGMAGLSAPPAPAYVRGGKSPPSRASDRGMERSCSRF